MRSVKIENLDWVTYKSLTENGQCRIILPVGAIEQHGPHMSLNPDVLIPSHIGEQVAERSSNMLVAEPVNLIRTAC